MYWRLVQKQTVRYEQTVVSIVFCYFFAVLNIRYLIILGYFISSQFSKYLSAYLVTYNITIQKTRKSKYTYRFFLHCTHLRSGGHHLLFVIVINPFVKNCNSKKATSTKYGTYLKKRNFLFITRRRLTLVTKKNLLEHNENVKKLNFYGTAHLLHYLFVLYFRYLLRFAKVFTL